METTASFGYWIRRQRKALDLTQQVLAERVGCSLAEIKKIEGDERKPSRQMPCVRNWAIIARLSNRILLRTIWRLSAPI